MGLNLPPPCEQSALSPCSLPLALAAACSDANSLGDATELNVVDTMTLGALEGTPISTPSGYRISTGPVRTDQTVDFEFAYNIRRLADGSYQRVLLPRAALGLTSTDQADPGLQRREQSFDDITSAPSNGYMTDSAVPVQVGERYVVRSPRGLQPSACRTTPSSRSSSFQDSTVTFQVLDRPELRVQGPVPGLPDN